MQSSVQTRFTGEETEAWGWATLITETGARPLLESLSFPSWTQPALGRSLEDARSPEMPGALVGAGLGDLLPFR